MESVQAQSPANLPARTLAGEAPRRNFTYAAIGIFLISFAIRLAFLLHTPLDLAIAEPKNVAIAILQGQGFANPYRCQTGPTAHCNPFLPVLIAGLYSIFGTGHGELARCLVSAAVLSLCYALLPWLARRLGLPSAAGAIAGLVCALFPFKRTSETVSFADEPFIAIALLFLVVYCFRLSKKKALSWSDAALYGAAWGAAFYVSASLLPVFLATLVLLLAISWTSDRAQIIKVTLSLAAALLLTAPWMLRNYRQLHTLAFMRTNFGLELFVANSTGASPSLKQNLLTRHQTVIHPLTSDTECAVVQQIGEPEYTHRKLNAALHWISENPASFAKLTVLRTLYFWAGDPLDYVTAIPNTLLSLAALIGWVLLRRRNIYAASVIACVFLFYPIVYYVVQTTPRYTLPIHPLVALCAGYAMYTVWTVRRARTHVWI